MVEHILSPQISRRFNSKLSRVHLSRSLLGLDLRRVYTEFMIAQTVDSGCIHAPKGQEHALDMMRTHPDRTGTPEILAYSGQAPC